MAYTIVWYVYGMYARRRFDVMWKKFVRSRNNTLLHESHGAKTKNEKKFSLLIPSNNWFYMEIEETSRCT